MEELCLFILGFILKYLKYNNIWICNEVIKLMLVSFYLMHIASLISKYLS